MQIILASASPRRSDLLKSVGLKFEVKTAEAVDEQRILDDTGSLLEDKLTRLAELKGKSVSMQYPDAIVISADTVVVDGFRVFGKPNNPEHAAEMLEALSGKSHRVMTAVCVQRCSEVKVSCFVDTTEVCFHQLSRKTIENYIRREQVMDKAGAYAIQGLGALLVKSVSGDYSTVVGLPVGPTCSLLMEFGIVVL